MSHDCGSPLSRQPFGATSFVRKSILNHSDFVSDERRVVVVTGAGGSGCGRAIAARFASAGALVVVSDINEAGGHDTVRLIEDRGGRAAFCRTDVRKESEVSDLISFAQTTFGGVTVFINNASAPLGDEASKIGWMP
jgi:NAD(P)-dependent dehydrogenase (short-subunit alcohol dehydrogenase family)